MDKKQKVIVIGGVCTSISVITAIVLLHNFYKRETELELTKEEQREFEYDEYERPTGYKSPFNVIYAHKDSLSAVLDDPFAVPRQIGNSGRFRRSGERW